MKWSNGFFPGGWHFEGFCSIKTPFDGHVDKVMRDKCENLKVRSYYAAIALGCHTAPYCTEIAMLLHCGVTWKLNSF